MTSTRLNLSTSPTTKSPTPHVSILPENASLEFEPRAEHMTMAPLKPKDPNTPAKKASAPKQINPTPINKENQRSSPKSTRKNATTSRPKNQHAPAPTPSSPPPSSSPPPPPPQNPNDEISDLEDGESIHLKWNCNQLRNKMDTWTNNTSTTLTDFQRKLQVSSASYRKFMTQSGAHAGEQSQVFFAATHFFNKREAKGLNMPRAPAAKKIDVEKFDVSGETPLDGERQGTVPVYDTCDDVRKKINNHLRTSNVTQAAFARAISVCQGEHGTAVQGRQIAQFCHKGKHGPMSGNTSKVFYAAYVYFEKLRIMQGKKKTKKRQEMEREYARTGGVDRDRVSENIGVWCQGNERPYVDHLGQIQIA